MREEKPWYKSRGKVGALIVAITGGLMAVGQFLQGNIDINGLLTGVGAAVGAALSLWGIRAKQES